MILHDLFEKGMLSRYLKQMQERFENRPALVTVYNLPRLETELDPSKYRVRYENTDILPKFEGEEPPDLIIHGIERIDDDFPGYIKRCQDAYIPLIIVLPAKDDAAREKLLSLDVEAVLEKPYSESDLLCRIRNLVRIRRLLVWNDQLTNQLTDLLQRRTHDLIDEERQTVIDNLVNGIFHNVRGPLTGLFFACDNMELTVQAMRQPKSDDTIKSDIAELDTSVSMVRQALVRMNDMLGKLVDRSEADCRAYPQVVDLNTLLTQEIELMKADMEFKHQIRKTIELHPEPMEVKVVRSEISQSIYSILRNAVEALIGFESPYIAIRTDLAEGMANIYIENNGPPITPETREHIFEPFFSTKQDIAKNNSGITIGKGLGLHFCRQSIRMNRGEIILESKQNANTRFRIKLPLHREP